ncbi:extracellular solute-binding protein family 1 [Paraburkholderia atlantica]|uniref:Extracellular solute-binding protein family 1 n=1 Tax=Paraburkholderia atlantica TaxID=2654982 RepID=D5WLC5_PARAM|nr:extracellular solute-binding protein [Paraburkholderia atlantica]ADG20021.1 extracellular solute-binding protein family 1 [Paraburkholderia atlantica]
MNHINQPRRRFLRSTGTLVAASALGPFALKANAAGTCSGQVVVGTWGGDYQRLLQQNIDSLVTPSGDVVTYSVGSALARQTTMRAEAHGRRSTMDVALLPNLANVIPQFRRSYAVPHIFSALVLVYDTDRVRTRPDGLAALLDPQFKGKIGLVDDQYDYLTLAGALASGGQVSDLALGQKYLRALREASPRVYPSVDALASALKSGEIVVTVTWKARTLQWKKAGLAVDYVFPKEGALPATFEAAVTAGSKSTACAFPYLNAMIDPRSQRAFAESMGYAPTITNADLPPSLQQAVGFSGKELERIVPVDFAMLMKHKTEMLDFWNKDFRAGL